ncbi:hypothetical protein KIH23_08275 [Flavobacterium sp. CYK-55]|uniref:hypothetical protein n=1 Tax=Flavobacterium sp. CYK-55 TaxID=2835529 RepID=UPI001BCBABC4|nr:hypothetical protein [Flavobacterium sp. CYK-55]MBS7787292.1 hypothetical protein [Flavobacterium sp. CYK-55]
MRKGLLVISLFLSIMGFAQKISATKIGDIKTISADDIFLGYDALGAFYKISSQTLIKQNDQQVWQYKNPQLGKIGSVDLKNPLKIVVFFEAQNTTAILDSQLNETQKINFNEKLPEILPAAIGLASGNRLWIYNSLTQRLGLYDYNLNKWQPLSTTLRSAPKNYTSDFNYFFWANTSGELSRCDVYGKIDHLGRLPENEQFVWAGTQSIILQSGNDLYWYDFTDNKRLFIEIDKKSFKNFTYKDQILSIFTNQGITNYKINLP